MFPGRMLIWIPSPQHSAVTVNVISLSGSKTPVLFLGSSSVGHTHKRLTESLRVPYYVSERFGQEYGGANLRQLERSVEDDYISTLRNNCWKEKQHSTLFTQNPKSFPPFLFTPSYIQLINT